MIKTILYASDLGAYSHQVLEHVLALAKQHEAAVHILHVLEPMGVMGNAVVATYLPELVREVTSSDMQQQFADNVKAKIIDTFEEDFMEGNDGLERLRDVQVVCGHPVDSIVEKAESLRADLLVVGSRSRQHSERHMLGSVVSKLMQLSRVPIYMVPIAEPSRCARQAS